MPNERTYYVLCEDNCRFESMTKEQIIAAIAEATGETPVHIDDAFITKIKEQNHQTALKFWKGTQAEWNALSPKPANTYPLITDSTATEDAIAAALNDHDEDASAHPSLQPSAIVGGGLEVVNNKLHVVNDYRQHRGRCGGGNINSLALNEVKTFSLARPLTDFDVIVVDISLSHDSTGGNVAAVYWGDKDENTTPFSCPVGGYDDSEFLEMKRYYVRTNGNHYKRMRSIEMRYAIEGKTLTQAYEYSNSQGGTDDGEELSGGTTLYVTLKQGKLKNKNCFIYVGGFNLTGEGKQNVL